MNKELIENNYIYIPNFISSHEAKKLADDYTQFCKETFPEGDVQIPNSHASYNFISFLELLCEKTPEVSKFLGESVFPTYTYSRIYRNGNILSRHTDREACEISLTLNLDCDQIWPICIKKPNGEEVSLNLKPGDAMMYLGETAEHWRNKFEGQKCTQVFLHYVRSRGKNSPFAFDNKVDLKPPTQICGLVKEEEKNTFNKSCLTNTQVEVCQEFTPTPLEEFIVTLDDIIDDDLCDLILKEYGNTTEWVETSVGGDSKIDRSVRNVDSIGLTLHETINQNQELRQTIDDRIFKCAGQAIKKYNEMFNQCSIKQDSGYELLRYKEGQFYVQHTDSFKEQPRSVSCSFALNDDYEGGEWGFFDNKIKIKPKKGSVVMFPSNFMYPHQINTVTKGTRYSIITWFI